MCVTEWIMAIICLLISATAAITDLKKRIVPNKLLYPAFGILLPLNLFFHFQSRNGWLYLRNVLFIVAFAVLLYAVHYFSAGDSKLLIVLATAMPTKLYQETLRGLFPIMTWVIILFSTAFLYLVGESVWLTVKKQKRFHKQVSFKQMLKNYMQKFVVVTAINECIWFFFPSFYTVNQYIIILLDYFLILILSEYMIQLPKNLTWVLAALVLAFGVLCGYLNGFHISSLLFIPFVLLFWALQSFLSAYNYRSIATSAVENGMILSLETSLLMQCSKVKGLPGISTEDLRSKLSEEDAESIRRWEKSKYGQREIVIVRTLPFGALIAAGTVLFIIERSVVMLWQA